MLCRKGDEKPIDLSTGKNRSCHNGVCGGWKFVSAGCDPKDIHCGGKGGAWLPVSVVCDLGLYASASTSSQATSVSNFNFSGSGLQGFNEFLEISIKTSSSSSQSSVFSLSESTESFSVVVRDVQLSAMIELASKPEEQMPCYAVMHNQECPDGSYFDGIVADCEGPTCDRICCPAPISEREPMICGKVYHGSDGHNSPWNFHMDPHSIKLKNRNKTSKSAIKNMSPSELQESLGKTIPEGCEFCVPVRGSVRKMRVSGPDRCGKSLNLVANRTFEEKTGEFIQETSCEGDCREAFGQWCLDDEIEAAKAENQKLIDKVVEQFSSMSDDEIRDQFVSEIGKILEGIDEDPDHVMDEEEIEQMLLADMNQSSSSSSSEEPEEASVSFDYEVDQISKDSNNPSRIRLETYQNNILSLVGGSFGRTYFSFEVPTGKTLVGMYAVLWSPAPNSADVALQAGESWGSRPILASSQFGNEFEWTALAAAMPLQEGKYTIRLKSNAPESECSMVLFLE